MNLQSLVLFTHVIGMIGLFVALALEGAAIARGGADLQAPRLFRGSLGVLVITGAYLARALVAGTGATLSDFGWLVLSVALVVAIGASGLLPQPLRHWLYPVRPALALSVVFLMIVEPRVNLAIAVTVLSVLGAAPWVVRQRRTRFRFDSGTPQS